MKAKVLNLDNQDAGVLHDIQVFTSAGAMLAATDAVAGPNTRSVTFTPPAAGSYPFKCSVHPRQMVGTLFVQ